jgi:hypothetical protein
MQFSLRANSVLRLTGVHVGELVAVLRKEVAKCVNDSRKDAETDGGVAGRRRDGKFGGSDRNFLRHKYRVR